MWTLQGFVLKTHKARRRRRRRRRTTRGGAAFIRLLSPKSPSSSFSFPLLGPNAWSFTFSTTTPSSPPPPLPRVPIRNARPRHPSAAEPLPPPPPILALVRRPSASCCGGDFAALEGYFTTFEGDEGVGFLMFPGGQMQVEVTTPHVSTVSTRQGFVPRSLR